MLLFVAPCFGETCVISPFVDVVCAESPPPMVRLPAPAEMRRLRPAPPSLLLLWFVAETVTWMIVEPPTVRHVESAMSVTVGAVPPLWHWLHPIALNSLLVTPLE
jgi:hypothetical protein